MRILTSAILFAAASALGCGSSGQPAAPAPTVTTAPATPAPAATPGTEAAPTGKTVDEGAFVIHLAGNEVGRETFQVIQTESGFAIVSDSTITVGGKELTNKGTVVTDDAWRPLSLKVASSRGEKTGEVTATRGADGLMDIVTSQNGKEYPQKTSKPGDLAISNNTQSHFTPLCRLPAAESGKKIVVPDHEMTYDPAQPVAVPGRKITVRELHLGELMQIRLACEDGRVLGVFNTAQDFNAVRQGEEAVVASLGVKPREKPTTPDTLVELPRQVKAPPSAGVGDAVLDCTLLVPASHAEVKAPADAKGKTKPLPAVVFISGSGPQDRDGDQIGRGPRLSHFKLLAIELGKSGIASLRCDDFGVGKSTGDAKLTTRTTLTALVLAQVQALRGEAAIDPKRIGLIGHSEGGNLAPLAAAEDPALRALVLMAAPGRTIDAILLEQAEEALRAKGAAEDAVKADLEKRRAIFAAMRKGEPLPAALTGDEREAWEEAAPWIKSYLDSDPSAVARKLKGPHVLIAQGERDGQVKVTDARLLGKAFKAGGNRKVVTKIYPELNHLFARSKTGDVAEYTSPDLRFDEAFTADVVAYLVKVL